MLTRDGGQELAYKHHWLYHVVWRADATSRETVASDGLTAGRCRHNWHPLFKPRPGHVYLATMDYVNESVGWIRHSAEDFYAIDTRYLEAHLVNADEDHFSGGNAGSCDRFGIARPPGMELYKAFGSAIVPSFGEWAEQVELGSEAHTRFSMDRGSIAYRGVVPPRALQRWDEERKTWT